MSISSIFSSLQCSLAFIASHTPVAKIMLGFSSSDSHKESNFIFYTFILFQVFFNDLHTSLTYF